MPVGYRCGQGLWAAEWSCGLVPAGRLELRVRESLATHRPAHWSPGRGWDHPRLEFIMRRGPRAQINYTIRQGTKTVFFTGIDWPCVETVAKDNYAGQFWGFGLTLPLLQLCWPGWPCLHSSAILKSRGRVWQNSRATPPEKLVLASVLLSRAKGGEFNFPPA